MLRDRFSKSVTLLGILDRFFKGRPSDTETSSGDIEPFRFESGHYMFEAQSFYAANEICLVNGKVIEVQIHRLDSLVAHLVDIASDGQARRSLFDYKCAHAAMRRLGGGIGLRKQEKDLSMTPISDPHF